MRLLTATVLLAIAVCVVMWRENRTLLARYQSLQDSYQSLAEQLTPGSAGTRVLAFTATTTTGRNLTEKSLPAHYAVVAFCDDTAASRNMLRTLISACATSSSCVVVCAAAIAQGDSKGLVRVVDDTSLAQSLGVTQRPVVVVLRDDGLIEYRSNSAVLDPVLMDLFKLGHM